MGMAREAVEGRPDRLGRPANTLNAASLFFGRGVKPAAPAIPACHNEHGRWFCMQASCREAVDIESTGGLERGPAGLEELRRDRTRPTPCLREAPTLKPMPARGCGFRDGRRPGVARRRAIWGGNSGTGLF
jgi:hypothetical protein